MSLILIGCIDEEEMESGRGGFVTPLRRDGPNPICGHSIEKSAFKGFSTPPPLKLDRRVFAP